MTFYKRNSSYWYLGFHEIFWLIIYSLAEYGCITDYGYTLVFSPYSYIIIKIKCSSDKNSKTNLPQNFKPPCQSIFISLFISNSLFMCKSLSSQLQVIINKTNDAQPNCSNKHQYYIYCIQPGKEQSRYYYTENDDHASHCWCSFLLLFACKSQVTNSFITQSFFNYIDESLTKYKCDDQR